MIVLQKWRILRYLLKVFVSHAIWFLRPWKLILVEKYLYSVFWYNSKDTCFVVSKFVITLAVCNMHRYLLASQLMSNSNYTGTSYHASTEIFSQVLQDFKGHKKGKVYCVAWNQKDSRRIASVGEEFTKTCIKKCKMLSYHLNTFSHYQLLIIHDMHFL